MTSSSLLLDGVRVTEVASFVAGPSAGLALSQLGADVTRIDPPGGAADANRWPLGPDGRSLYWAGLNRGKRSVTLDLNAEAGRAVLRQALCRAGAEEGILLTNLYGKAWLSDQSLRALRSDLIHVQIRGRRDGGAAVDYTVNAATGLPFATGHDPLIATNNALPAWDLLCGMHAAIAILGGLYRRKRTGEGTFATIALDDIAASTLTVLGVLPEAQLTGRSRAAIGNSVYGTFGVEFPVAGLGSVMVVALTQRQWTDLLEVTHSARMVGLVGGELGVDFLDEGVRYEHRQLLTAILSPWFAERTLAEVAAGLAGTSVLWSPFRRLTDLAAELERGVAAPTVVAGPDDSLGNCLASSGPIRFPSESARGVAQAPLLGEHTAQWLSDIQAGGDAG